MNTPIVNVEEKIDRFVGRRAGMADALDPKYSTKAGAAAWRRAFGGVRIPRGVHRFDSHEEADVWMTKMLAGSELPKT